MGCQLTRACCCAAPKRCGRREVASNQRLCGDLSRASQQRSCSLGGAVLLRWGKD
jgi:hypothetical protein